MYYPHKKIIALQTVSDLEHVKTCAQQLTHSN
jgi:hypothetical protein